MFTSRVVSVCVDACVLASLAVFASIASAGQAEDPAKGAALLAEARKAVGGEDKLADVKRLQINPTFKANTFTK
jgi:hypothetical protein